MKEELIIPINRKICDDDKKNDLYEYSLFFEFIEKNKFKITNMNNGVVEYGFDETLKNYIMRFIYILEKDKLSYCKEKGDFLDFVVSKRQMGVSTFFIIFMVFRYIMHNTFKGKEMSVPAIQFGSTFQARMASNFLKNFIELNNLKEIIPFHKIVMYGTILTLETDKENRTPLIVDYGNNKPILSFDHLSKERPWVYDIFCDDVKIINNMTYDFMK